MNQDQVKALLLSVEKPQSEFSVVFSGKKSAMVNGLYKPVTREILIHNKNFQADGQLVYTALHEYAHHLHCERKAWLPGARAHTNEFWSIFHELLEKAEATGAYRNVFSEEPEFAELTARIKDVLPENGRLMLEFGKLVIEAEALCKKHFVRFEDYIDRALGVSRVSASSAMKAFHLDVPPALGWDAMKLVAGIARPDLRAAAIDAFQAGKSQEAVKALARNGKPAADPREQLDREKARLERTIQAMQERLEAVQAELARLQDGEA